MMESQEKVEPREVHYTIPQLRSLCIEAQHEVAIWGRGSGKSDGRIAPRMSKCAFTMPRSLGGIEARSFTQILTRTLPPVIRGFERIGYKLNRDFTVRERGPKSWPLPVMPPLMWNNAIHFRNGSACALISQQNPGSANGISLDWLIADEAKLLKKEQHEEEVLPAMRGNRDRFGHLSLHQSTLLATDMPTTPQARWILDKEQEMDRDAIEAILGTQFEISRLDNAIRSGGLSKASAAVYHRRINSLQKQLELLRMGTLYFSMSNALDNIAVLGESYLARMKQNLPDYLFRTSIMNLRPDRIEGGFYPNIDEAETYIAPVSSHISAAGNDFELLEADDCRKDGMLVPTLPLNIAPDFGSSFNCLVIGQLFDLDLNVDNQVYVKHPGKIKDLAKKFHLYYQYMAAQHVRLFFDHTMIGEDAVREYGFILELKRELELLGWTVELVYIGQAPGHHEKYVFMARAIGNVDPRLPRLRFNEENTEPTLLSMRLAGAKQSKRGFEKDKDAERDSNADQAETTHLSDACDLLVIGTFLTLSGNRPSSVDVIM